MSHRKAGHSVNNFNINGQTFSIRLSDHAELRIKQRGLDLFQAIGTILSLGEKRILNYRDSGRDIMIMDKEKGFSIVAAIEGNSIVNQVYEDYQEHQEKLQDNDYSSIYNLVDKFESNWNCYGDANLKYDIDIKNNYLYLENARICPIDDLLCCSVESDSIKYQLRDNRYLYIVIHWVDGSDAYIDQIYIQNENDEDDFEMLYEK